MEGIVDLQIDLHGFVKLCRLLDDLDRVALVDIGNKLKDHCSSLDISLFLVRENDFTANLLRDARLEPDREWDALSRLDSHFILFHVKVTLGREQLDPVRDGRLRWIRQFNVLGHEIAEHCRELNNSFGNIVRQCLIELCAEDEQFTG